MWKRKSLSVAGRIVTSIDSRLAFGYRWIIIVGSLVVAFSVFTDVFVRFVLRRGIWGTEEIAMSVMMWLWMTAIVYTTRQRSHVSSNFPIRNRSAQQLYRIVSPCVCLIIMLIFCYFSYEYSAWLIFRGSRTVIFGIPQIYIFGAVFISFTLTSGYLIWEIVDNIRAFRHARTKGEE